METPQINKLNLAIFRYANRGLSRAYLKKHSKIIFINLYFLVKCWFNNYYIYLVLNKNNRATYFFLLQFYLINFHISSSALCWFYIFLVTHQSLIVFNISFMINWLCGLISTDNFFPRKKQQKYLKILSHHSKKPKLYSISFKEFKSISLIILK